MTFNVIQGHRWSCGSIEENRPRILEWSTVVTVSLCCTVSEIQWSIDRNRTIFTPFRPIGSRTQKTRMTELSGDDRISTICLAVLTQYQHVTDAQSEWIIWISRVAFANREWIWTGDKNDDITEDYTYQHSRIGVELSWIGFHRKRNNLAIVCLDFSYD